MDCIYLENIDELINDQKKIVTYRSLSLNLKVSSNISKQMLYHYYEKHKPSCDISVTFLVSGIIYDEKLKQDIQKVCVVREENLESVKRKLKKISSLHIYSLQRGRLKDLNALYSTDFDTVKENISSSSTYSSITCPAASLRVEDSTKDQQKFEKCKETDSARDRKLDEPSREDSLENKENKSDNAISRGKTAPKKEVKGALASMFANQTKKLAAQNSNSEKEKKNDVNNQPVKTSHLSAGLKKGSLSSFLTKGKTPLAEALKKERKQDVITEKKKPDPIKEELESEEETVLIEEKKVQRETKKKQSIKAKKPASKGKRKSSEPLSDEKNKRRRIVTWDSSSESSNEEEELMEECPLPSPPPKTQKLLESDDDDVIPPTPQSSASCDVTKSSKGKKRKMVDKTYLDDDGYLVTKKESIFVSDSDEENPVPSPTVKKTSPQVKKETVKREVLTAPTSHPTTKRGKKSSPVNTKQASIMSFFKKK